MRKLKESVLCLYFFTLFLIYPFYFQEGYIRIGQAKYVFLKWSSLFFLVLLMPLMIWLHDLTMSYLDYMLMGYLLINALSCCISPYKDTVLFGTVGWNLGLFSQFMFVFICFAAERWQGFELWGIPAFVWMAVAGASGVFVLGILNRFSVYPIPMAGFNPVFLSTLGNINWYSGYWSVLAPLGWGVYVVADRRKEARCTVVRIFLGIFCFLAILAGVTAGSSSVFLVFGVCMAAFCWKSFEAKKWLLGTLEWTMIAALAMQAVRWLYIKFPAGMQYDSDVIRYLMFHPVGWYVFFPALIIYAAVLFALPEYGEKSCPRRVRAYVFAVLAAAGICAGIVFVINSAVPGGIWPVSDVAIFYFSDIWGNGRGGIWKNTLMAMRQMSVSERMFGVGPDCYVCFIYRVPEITERLIRQFGSNRLTNAHNECLTVLVNTGFFGLLFYIGIFVTAGQSFVKRIKEEPILFAVILAMLGYVFHNTVSFSQVLSTPFVFLIMGLGQGLTKQVDSPKVVNRCF